jgi:DEAD/DEAH box helicase domain-containing protein
MGKLVLSENSAAHLPESGFRESPSGGACPADCGLELSERSSRGLGGNMKKPLFFDLETQKSFDEVGGRQNLRQLRMSVAITYDSFTGQFCDYHEADVQKLVKQLQSAELVVGYNIISFDYEVLRAYTMERLETIPTVDMLRDIYQQLGFRVSLDSVAGATIGVKKSADGLEAIRWFRQGEIDKLLSYCRQDVQITRQVYEYGQQKGHVLFWDRNGQKRRVQVNW